MRKSTILWLTVLTLILTTVGIGSVFAQGQTIKCESTGSDYQYCRVNTDNNVHLETQLSISQCTYNYSWGYDRRGIWVDRGCRAEFSYGRNSDHDHDLIRSANEAYNFGYSSGRNDARRGLSNDSARHLSNVASSFRSNYRDGYRAGFQSESNSSNFPGNGNETQQAYRNGYNRGIQDARANRSSDFRRYNNEFNRNTRQNFSNGYETGYRSINNGNYYPGNSNSRVPNWLIGTWQVDQGTQTLDVTFSPSGQITILTIPRRGQRSTSHGYYQNGSMVIPDFTTYEIRQQGNQMVAVNVRNRNDKTQYRRIR